MPQLNLPVIRKAILTQVADSRFETGMAEFNLIDLAAAVTIILSAYFAYLRGAVKEITSIAVWVVAALAAYFLAPQAIPMVEMLPVLGPYFAESCEIAVIVAFTLVFAIALIICSVLATVLVRVAAQPVLGIFNRGFGLVFGVFRGILIIAVLLILYDAVLSNDQAIAMVSESNTAMIFHDLQMSIQQQIPSNTASKLSVIYNNVTAVCSVQVPSLPEPPALPDVSELPSAPEISEVLTVPEV